jgi:hypothetical protein
MVDVKCNMYACHNNSDGKCTADHIKVVYIVQSDWPICITETEGKG